MAALKDGEILEFPSAEEYAAAIVAQWAKEGSADDGIGYGGDIPAQAYRDVAQALDKHGLLRHGAALKSSAHLLRLASDAFEASAAALLGDSADRAADSQEAALRDELEQKQLRSISSPVPEPGNPMHSSDCIVLSANVLCVKAAIAAQGPLCFAGLADGSLLIAVARTEVEEEEGNALTMKWSVKETRRLDSTGGILCIDCRESSVSTVEVCCGTMGGLVLIFDVEADRQSVAQECALSARQRCSEQAHSKYCSGVTFIENGLVSGGYDHCVCIFTFSHDDPCPPLTMIKRITLESSITSLVRDAAFDRVLLATTDSHELKAIKIKQCQKETHPGPPTVTLERWNVNPSGDSHVSFSVRALALSSCGRFLAGATDNGRVVLWVTAPALRQIRALYGLPTVQYFQPEIEWVPGCESRILAVSCPNSWINICDILNETVLAKIKAHAGTIRCLDCSTHFIVSGGFDRTVWFWNRDPNVGQQQGTEYLDVLDSVTLQVTDVQDRKTVHRRGLLHRVVYVMLESVENDGERSVLLQQRAGKKKIGPELWDISIAEHLTAGESSLEGALRGIREELGLSAAAQELEAVSSWWHRESFDDLEVFENELVHVYRWTGWSGHIQVDPDEVMATRVAKLSDTLADLEANPGAYTSWLAATLLYHYI